MTKGFAIMGIKGSGKTTFSNMLGKELNIPVLDTDNLIEQKVKESCRSFYKAKGETAFREAEYNVLTNLCIENNNIIALGGGFAYHKEIFDKFKKYYHLIFIHVDPKISYKRVSSETAYLVNQEDKKDTYIRISESRNTLYSKICDYVVYSSVKSKKEIFDLLKEYITKHECK